MKHALAGSQSGVASLIVLAVMVGLSLVAAAFIAQICAQMRMGNGQANAAKAFYVAEAGLYKAVWYLANTAPDGSTGASWRTKAYPTASGSDVSHAPTDPISESFGEGNYIMWVETQSGNMQITARGSVNGMTKTVRQKFSAGASSVFNQAIYAQGSVSLSNNASIDSYNSALGSYGGANVGSNGDVYTNSTAAGSVTLGNNASIAGSVGTGPGGTVQTGANALITGSQTHTQNAALSPITVPAALQTAGPGGTLSIGNNGSSSLAAGNYKYVSLSLSNNATLTISGDVSLYLTGNPGASLGNNSKIVLNANAHLKIFADGALSFSNNSVVNNPSSDPAAMVIYSRYTGANGVVFSNNSPFYGAVYAPDTDVVLSNNAKVYGALVASSISLSNNAAVHFDTALRTYTDLGVVGGNSSGAITAVHNSWQEL